MPNLDIIYDVTIAVTWDEIKTYKWVIYQPTCLASFVTFDGYSASVYDLKLLVLEGTGGKTLATDHRAGPQMSFVEQKHQMSANFSHRQIPSS